VINGRFTGAISVQQKHNITLSAVFVKRTVFQDQVRSVTELTATVGYTYSFRKDKKDRPQNDRQ
jgi:hypothetical protein